MGTPDYKWNMSERTEWRVSRIEDSETVNGCVISAAIRHDNYILVVGAWPHIPNFLVNGLSCHDDDCVVFGGNRICNAFQHRDWDYRDIDGNERPVTANSLATWIRNAHIDWEVDTLTIDILGEVIEWLTVERDRQREMFGI